MIGALNAQSQQLATFSDQDATTLLILGDQLASAIENSRLYSELHRSEEKYRTILEIIEEGYYETDLECSFTFVNQTVCNILGYPQEEILGASYYRFADPEDVERLCKTFEQVLRTGKLDNSVEYKTHRKDGRERVIETYVSIANDPAGQPGGLRGILRDITRRKQAEQAIIERKALERSNRELEQFAYVASHDLQEPLRKIQAFGNRLKTTSSAALDKDGLDYLERMMNAGNRMQALINDLLTLSRLKTQAQPFVPVNLTQVTHEVLSDLETRIERVSGRVEVGELPTLEADPIQMRQLLQNLIGNALKFHKPGQPPVIKVYSQALSEPRSGQSQGYQTLYQIFVADNGIGFDEKYLDRIFQPFQRLHTRSEYEGNGVGLSICQAIIERHSGRLSAHSAPGEGATFIITLPLNHNQGNEYFRGNGHE